MDTDRIIFSQSIPTLQAMAAHATALPIWQEYVFRSEDYQSRGRGFFEDSLCTTLKLCANYSTENDELIKSLRTSPSIEKILMTFFINIRNETHNWIQSFQEVFADSLEKYAYRIRRIDIKKCCWTYDLKIDYVRTVLNMLSMEELSEVQKFILLCKYCLANEITSFPRRFLRGNVVKILREDTLLDYWICQLKKERFRMPRSHVSNLNTSVDVSMAWYTNNIENFGFQYFWDRLNANDRVIIASKILPFSSENQFYILSKLSMLHQRRLICKIPGAIVKNFILDLDMWRNGILSWQTIKNEIKEQNFSTLVSSLLEYENYETEFTTDHLEKCDTFLIYVWETAPDRLRNYILQVKIDEIVGEFFRDKRTYTANSLKFLYGVLAMKSAEYRRKLILDNAVSLVTNVPVFEPQLTTNLLEMCLPNNNDRLEFQKLVLASDGVREQYKSLMCSINQNQS